MPVLFCSACGATLHHEPPVRCDGCGVRHWRNAKPASAALVVRDGKVLLVRRANEPWLGTWGPPGGFCEPWEHPIDAAQREVLEETGLAVRCAAMLGIWLGAYRGPDQAENEIVLMSTYYLASITGPYEPVPDPVEVAEIAWWPVGELPGELAFPEMHGPALVALGRVTDLERASREDASLDRG
jgi:8-oxo-dGTP diphosphatase